MLGGKRVTVILPAYNAARTLPAPMPKSRAMSSMR